MNRFTLPVAFAAAFHGALLLGFSKPPRLTPPIQKDKTTTVVWYVPVDEPPLVEQTDRGSSDSKPIIDAPPLRSAEPPTVTLLPDDFKTATPPPLPGIERSDATKIAIDTLPGNGVGEGIAGRIFPPDWLDKSPRTRFQAPPSYPFEAKKSGLRGEVVVEFVVDEQGRVVDPRVVSSTDRVFEQPTLNAVSRWVFEPGRRDGQVVRFRMAVPVVFNLND